MKSFKKKIAKDDRIRVRVTTLKKRKVTELAKSKGLDVSKFIDRLLDQALDQAAA